MEPKDMELAIIRNLPKRTGKTLEQWIALVRKDGPPGKKARISWLESTYRIGHFQARTIASCAARSEMDSESSQAEALFSSASEGVLAVYGLILDHLRSLGHDIRAIPSDQYIFFVRSTPFLALKPAGTGLIMGLRLETGGSNARLGTCVDFDSIPEITHQIVLSSPMDVDNVVIGLIKTAYGSA